jgi:hypothetical protein
MANPQRLDRISLLRLNLFNQTVDKKARMSKLAP